MQPRQSITDLFSTFLQFQADRFERWAIDPTLVRSVKHTLEPSQDDLAFEQFWAIYWHKRLASDALAAFHLSAYLQESCYWAAQKTIARIAQPPCGVSDCFQMAIAQVPKILKACDPDHYASLKTYSSVAFGNMIRDGLRQQEAVDLCNDWALLLKLSRKRLQAALAGLPSESIARSILVWQCYEQAAILHKPLRQIKRPDAEMWETIARLYNQQRREPSECRPETLEKWLLDCARRARAALHPAVASLNTPKANSGEWQDDLPATESAGESPIALLIAGEEAEIRRSQSVQVRKVLEDALTHLDSSAERLLRLYYQQGLTQQQIAQQLEVQQYSISRRLARARENLLLALSRWSKETLHISLTSHVIKHISTVLEEWLQEYYSAPNDAAPNCAALTDRSSEEKPG